MSIKNVVFDLGRVLIDYNPTAYMQSLGLTDEQINLVSRLSFGNPIWPEVDRGTYTFGEMTQIICEQNPEHASLVRKVFCENWFSSEKAFPLMPESEAFLMKLKAEGYKIYILSNFSYEGFAHTEEKFEFFKHVDGKVVSSHVHMNKPEPEIYQYLLDTFGLIAEETVFLDDLLVNVEAAARFGIKTILFTDLDSAIKEFEAMTKERLA